MKYNGHVYSSYHKGLPLEGEALWLPEDVQTYEQKDSGKWPPTQRTGAQTPGLHTLRLTPAYTKA
jgi:hypothetical protein